MVSAPGHGYRRSGPSSPVTTYIVLGAAVILLGIYCWSLSSENKSLRNTMLHTYTKLRQVANLKVNLEKRNTVLSNRMVEMEEQRDNAKETKDQEKSSREQCEKSLGAKEEQIEEASIKLKKVLDEVFPDGKAKNPEEEQMVQKHSEVNVDAIIQKIKDTKVEMSSIRQDYMLLQNKFTNLDKEHTDLKHSAEMCQKKLTKKKKNVKRERITKDVQQMKPTEGTERVEKETVEKESEEKESEGKESEEKDEDASITKDLHTTAAPPKRRPSPSKKVGNKLQKVYRNSLLRIHKQHRRSQTRTPKMQPRKESKRKKPTKKIDVTRNDVKVKPGLTSNEIDEDNSKTVSDLTTQSPEVEDESSDKDNSKLIPSAPSKIQNAPSGNLHREVIMKKVEQKKIELTTKQKDASEEDTIEAKEKSSSKSDENTEENGEGDGDNNDDNGEDVENVASDNKT